MIDATDNPALSLLGVMRGTLIRAAAWLTDVDEHETDPFLDPVFRSMSPRERADLPFTRWPSDEKTSPAPAPERLKKMPERTASPAPGLPKEGVDVQQAKRWASAP
jgi:hypothetical protein